MKRAMFAVAGVVLSGLIAANATGQVLIDADWDANNPEQNTQYTYGTFINGAGGETATGGVGGTAGYAYTFDTNGSGNFGGYGVGPRSFITAADFDTPPTSLSDFKYSADVKIDGASGNSGLELRLEFGGSQAFDIPLPYDTALGGFQTFSGDFGGASGGNFATFLTQLPAITNVRLIQSGDLPANSVYGQDTGNVVTLDNVTLSLVVPEPASTSLLGVAGLGLLRRRRRA